MAVLQEWEIAQRAEWERLFNPYFVSPVDEHGEALAHCPIHDDSNPSANVNVILGVWNCFGCGRGGPIDLIKVTLEERIRNGFLPPWVTGEMLHANHGADAEPLPSMEDLRQWNADLLADEAAVHYIHSTRGISKQEITKRLIVMRPHRRSGVVYGIPVFEDNRLANIRWYSQKNPVRGIPKKIWSVRGHGRARLYPEDVLLNHDDIVIVEGEFDALLLNSHGFNAITPTGGAGSSKGKRWRPEWNEWFEDKVVTIIPDHDVPGMEFAHTIAGHLSKHAAMVAIAKLGYEITEDHGKDVSDFMLIASQHADLQAERLRDIIASAQRQTYHRNMSNDPQVRKMKHHMRLMDHAKREQRKEERLLAWHEPPSTINLEDELRVPLAPFTYTIERLHVHESNCLLRSRKKVGKSTLLLNLMKSLADGDPFLGQLDVTPVGRVAFWNYEVSRVQFNRWIRSVDITNKDRCSVWHLRGEHLDLEIDELFDKAVEWLMVRGIDTLVIDTYARAFVGDENDNSAVGKWLDRLDQLKRETGIKDLFMSAHFGHSGEERARGAARLEDWADGLWAMVREGSDRYFSADGRDVAIPESRLEFDDNTHRLRMVGGSRADQRSEKIAHEAVALVSTRSGELTHAQLVDALAHLGGSKAERSEAVAEAASAGLIQLDQSTTPARYRARGW